MKLLIMQSSPASRHFLLGPNILLSESHISDNKYKVIYQNL